MSKHLSIAVVVLFAVVSGIQASSDEVKTKFIDAKISPDVLESVPDLKALKISYPSGVTVNLGNVLTPTQVQDQPKVEWDAEEGVLYTLLMTDPDAPEVPKIREVRHWLAVNIAGNDLTSGETKAQFIGSGPKEDTGLHRYVFVLFKQPNGKIEVDLPFVSDHSLEGRLGTSTKEFAAKHGLVPVAGNYYRAEYDDYVPSFHMRFEKKSEMLVESLKQE